MHATNYDIGCDKSQSYYRNSSPSSRSSSSSILSVAFRALQAIAQFFCSIPSKISNFFFPVQPGRYSQGYHYNSAAPSAPPLPEMQPIAILMAKWKCFLSLQVIELLPSM